MSSEVITIDAKDQILGRLASRVAVLLQGKAAADYAPNKIGEGKIRVINISKIKLSGRKFEDKVYKRHTGYLGGLKTRKFSEVFTQRPEETFKNVVKGMLPKNKLLNERLKKLIIEN